MIPADVASRLKLAVPDQPAATQPVTPLKNLPDVLSDLVPGQRVMAEIQALLPNGSYRAVVAQRDITLALPFSAKKGDSLELEVVESDGKLTLAVVNSRSGSTSASSTPDSVSTSLSNTGKLIGDLLGGVGEQGKRAAPAPLNGNQPLVDDLPGSAPQLAPILKEALSKSGVFYEAHQARWVAGELPTDALRQEPQGKLSSATPNATIESKNTDSAPTSVAARAESSAQAGTTIPRDLTPIVQQQLDALATQNYAWQGQIWPGQQMQWEITENPDNARSADSEAAGRWQTRLKLTLPMLGGIDTVLRLRPNGEVDISMTTDSENSESRLRQGATALRTQMEAAGLNLTQLLVQHGEATS
ncbi:hypothetical protein AT959_14115 [Dechloromonas denitrificans]|uniref:Flagellar hook-length control protein-like C-terminal domain-containing protein n=1 Tax=Dechloromonas denitrificans TaxID=281362 RepID=A0A133XHP5_9RHOO|nr:flagellar hook-length control protein FliK [Dechloromonas denitrificans]KXB30463.1 hypothetical protein AT959_14115 [Dechloromonas denitrificans]